MIYAITAMALATFLLGTNPALASHDVITIQTTLDAYLNEVVIPDKGSNAFVEPTAADISSFRTAISIFVDNKYALVAPLFDKLGYDLGRVQESTAVFYYVLREKTDPQGNPLRGLGTFVYNPNYTRSLSLHVPHPHTAGSRPDFNTLPQGIKMFTKLKARFLFIAGTNRCANSSFSSCDGVTSVCNDNNNPERYRVSDAGHYQKTFFQAAHEILNDKLKDLVTVSIHGFDWKKGLPDVIISNGASGKIADENNASLKLAEAYKARFKSMGILGKGVVLTAQSCNAVGEPALPLCGTTNVQGRYSNGANDVCSGNTPRNPIRDSHFIHIEQSCALRNFRPCSRGRVGYDMSIDVFKNVFPELP